MACQVYLDFRRVPCIQDPIMFRPSTIFWILLLVLRPCFIAEMIAASLCYLAIVFHKIAFWRRQAFIHPNHTLFSAAWLGTVPFPIQGCRRNCLWTSLSLASSSSLLIRLIACAINRNFLTDECFMNTP